MTRSPTLNSAIGLSKTETDVFYCKNRFSCCNFSYYRYFSKFFSIIYWFLFFFLSTF